MVTGADGGLAALVMGYDGVSLGEYCVGPNIADLQLISIEYAPIVREIRRTLEIIQRGELEEVTVTSGNNAVFIKTMTDNLFSILIMKRDGAIGRGRYLLKLKTYELLRELS